MMLYPSNLPSNLPLKLLVKHLKYTATSTVLSDLMSTAVMGRGRKGEDLEAFAYLLLSYILLLKRMNKS